MKTKVYQSKLLLFGEYLVLVKGKALARPLNHFNGQWVYLDDPEENNPYYHAFLSLSTYFRKNSCSDFLNLDALDADIRGGLHFESNIKTGYGTGSSGALVAAIYDLYAKEEEKNRGLESVREQLILMESFFHGKSSGVDPLVSYTDKTVLLGPEGSIDLLDIKEEGISCFLIDSGKSRSTEPLVKVFKEKMNNQEYLNRIINPLKLHSDKAIDAYLKGHQTEVVRRVAEISALQYEGFQEMILPEFQVLWQQSLKQDQFSLKLCGAGGGGFYLAFGDEEDIRSKFSAFDIIKV